MKNYQFFMLMFAIYGAPHFSLLLAKTSCGLFLVMSVIWLIVERKK
jgi:hypothetical protein